MAARHKSTKMILGLATIFGYRIISTNIIYKNLYSAEKIQHNILVRDSEILELGPDNILESLRSFYGFAEVETTGKQHSINIFYIILVDKTCNPDPGLLEKH